MLDPAIDAISMDVTLKMKEFKVKYAKYIYKKRKCVNICFVFKFKGFKEPYGVTDFNLVSLMNKQFQSEPVLHDQGWPRLGVPTASRADMKEKCEESHLLK